MLVVVGGMGSTHGESRTSGGHEGEGADPPKNRNSELGIELSWLVSQWRTSKVNSETFFLFVPSGPKIQQPQSNLPPHAPLHLLRGTLEACLQRQSSGLAVTQSWSTAGTIL